MILSAVQKAIWSVTLASLAKVTPSKCHKNRKKIQMTSKRTFRRCCCSQLISVTDICQFYWFGLSMQEFIIARWSAYWATTSEIRDKNIPSRRASSNEFIDNGEHETCIHWRIERSGQSVRSCLVCWAVGEFYIPNWFILLLSAHSAWTEMCVVCSNDFNWTQFRYFFCENFIARDLGQDKRQKEFI